jgi:DNA-binding NarL/FixJ family response regulator
VRPAVVILDQVMPGWSGRQTFDRLKGDGFDGVVVVLSPRPESADARSLREAGVDALLAKAAPSPVIEAELRQILLNPAAA